MGFGNGYDSGYSDALEDVRNGKVPGTGPASGGGGATPTFDAGVLEGYDVEKLLSADGMGDYLSSLTDAQIKGLVVYDTTSNIRADYDMIRSYLTPDHDRGLAKILYQVLDEAYSRGILEPVM